MAKLIDLTGQRFGRLTVIARVENTPTGHARWQCKCACGQNKIVSGYHLRQGNIVSCGCNKNEKSSKRASIRNTIHGKRDTRLYRIWHSMKERCYNPKHRFYDRYGARGITICDEWLHNFQAFWDWAMANGYRDDLSIDRIDNDKGYNPDNCRWATEKEQSRNTKRNYYITLSGETKTLAEWCEEYEIKYGLVHARLRYGWSPEEALGIVPRKKR